MTELEKKVLDLIDEDEVIAFLQALIRARSDYPPGDTRKICQICLDKLHSCGIDSAVMDVIIVYRHIYRCVKLNACYLMAVILMFHSDIIYFVPINLAENAA